MITERDYKILNFLSEFMHAKRKVIAGLFHHDESVLGDVQATHRRITKLLKQGYLVREKDYRTGEYIYRLSRKASKLLNTAYEKKTRFWEHMKWNHFVHNDLVQDVFIEFYKAGYTQFYPERSFKRKQYDYIPDIAFHVNNKMFVVEVELEQKASSRVWQKLDFYSDHEKIDTVFYLCIDNKILNPIKKIVKKENFSFEFLSCTKESFFKNPFEITNYHNNYFEKSLDI